MKKAIAFFLSVFVVFCSAAKLPADGNVSVQVSNAGDLRVRGVNNTEQCIMVTPGPGPFQLTFSDVPGLCPEPTTFNSQSMLTVDNVIGDMRFDLKSGPKVLVICEDFDGEESFFSEIVALGDLKITSSGSDRVIVLLDGIEVEGRTIINTKNGDDAILFFDCVLDLQCTVTSGGGNDVIGSDEGTEFGFKAKFKTGAGNDVALFIDSVFEMESDVSGGSGNDGTAFCRCNFQFDGVVVNGNGGFDEFAEDDSLFITGLILRSIESERMFFEDVSSAAFANVTFQEALDICLQISCGGDFICNDDGGSPGAN